MTTASSSSARLLSRVAALSLATALAACSAGGDSSGSGARTVIDDDGVDGSNGLLGDGSNTDTGFPNDGSVGGIIRESDNAIAGNGAQPAQGFICTQSASLFDGATTEVGFNGLVGGLLGGLLSTLAGDSVTSLLNNVADKDLAIDNDLRTAAAISQTLSGLGGLLGSVDLNVHLAPGTVRPAGSFAVFAVSFPGSLLDVGLLSNVQVTTLLNDQVQEDSVRLDASGLSLLGRSIGGTAHAVVGLKTTLPYDSARIRAGSGLLSVDVGPSVFVHEFCTDGRLVTPPAA